jgi:hypothetical protein
MKEEQEQPETAAAETGQNSTETQQQPEKQAKDSLLRRCWHWIAAHKKITIPVAVIVFLAILGAVPLTRFAIAGTFLKQDFTVRVIDQETHKPVSGALVTVAGKRSTTDNQGKALVRVRVGGATLSITKKYYQNASKQVVVPILKQKDIAEVPVKATGRQVPVTVMNKISKKPLANITFVVLGTETKTDVDGKAVLVLPADKTTASASVSGDGYNTATVTIKITTEADETNNFELTPSGKIYFLSNQSGKLDVVKSNLDGTERQTILAGTGSEDKSNTLLLASRDWKYLALLSKRDGGDNAKLFLIETATDKVTTMDEGKAEFTIYGWADHRFVYKVNRTEVKYWQPNRFALKSYDAVAHKITTLDQTQAEGSETGYAAEDFGTVYLVNNQLIYTVTWGGWSSLTSGKSHVIRGVQADGQNKKDYKTFASSQYGWITSNPYAFNEIYFQTWDNQANKNVYFEFEDGKVGTANITDNEFQQGYPTYFISPSANHTFWTDVRDGKDAFFVGDKDGKNGQQIATLSEYKTYGWFTDDYLLVSKKGSELYILPVAGLKSGEQPQKLTDYYRPAYFIIGYGGGY